MYNFGIKYLVIKKLPIDYINHFYESIVNNIEVFDIEKQIELFEKIYLEVTVQERKKL